MDTEDTLPDKQKDNLPEDVTDGGGPTLVDGAADSTKPSSPADSTKPSSPGRDLQEEIGMSCAANDSNGEVANIQSEIPANQSSNGESEVIEGNSENPTNAEAVSQDGNVEMVDTAQGESVDTAQGESLDTSQVESEDTAHVESVDITQTSETAETPLEDIQEDTDKDIPENVTDDIPENVTDDISENVTDDISENVTDDISENVTDDISENVTDDISENVTDEISENVTDDISENVTDDISETPGESETVGEPVAMDNPEETHEAENMNTMATKDQELQMHSQTVDNSTTDDNILNMEQDAVDRDDDNLLDDPQSTGKLDNDDETSIEAGILVDSGDVGKADEIAADDDIDEDELLQTQKDSQGDPSDGMAMFESSAPNDESNFEHMDTEQEHMDTEQDPETDSGQADGTLGYAKDVADDESADMETADGSAVIEEESELTETADNAESEITEVADEKDESELTETAGGSEVAIVQDESDITETADETAVADDNAESEITEVADEKDKSEITETAGETEVADKDESEITEAVNETDLAIEKVESDIAAGNVESATQDDMEPIEAIEETNVDESPTEQAEIEEDEALLDLATESENADLPTVDEPLSTEAEEADVSACSDIPVASEIEQTEEPAPVAEPEFIDLDETESNDVVEPESNVVHEVESNVVHEVESNDVTEPESIDVDETESNVVHEVESNDVIEPESIDVDETESKVVDEVESNDLDKPESNVVDELKSNDKVEPESINVDEPESIDVDEPESNEVDASDILSPVDTAEADTAEAMEMEKADLPAAVNVEAEHKESEDVEPVQIDSDVEMVEEATSVEEATPVTAENQGGEVNKDIPAAGDGDKSPLTEPATKTLANTSDIPAASVSDAPATMETTPVASIDLTDEEVKPEISDVNESELSVEKNGKLEEPIKSQEEPIKSEDVKEEDEKDNISDIKIVGVTSASSQVDETPASDELDLKISSVSGSVESKDVKAEETKVDVKDGVKVQEKPQESVTPKTAELKNETKTVKPGEDDDVIAIKEEKKPKPKSSSKIQTCIVCAKVGKCKYNIVRNGDVKHLCDDACFKRFRSSPTTFLRQAEKGPARNGTQANTTVVTPKPKAAPVKATPPTKPAMPPQSTGGQVYKTCNVCQLMNVRTSKPFLNWQGLDFCGEECLGKFQGSLSVTCSYCSSQIHQANKAKFCWRVGDDVKHFCSQTCNNEFVKRMKVCTFCNKDLATVGDSFMAPVGNQGFFKDFCSQNCLQKFEEKNNMDLEIVGVQKGQKSMTVPKGSFYCAVCGKVGPVKHEFRLDGKVNRLCSDPCYSAFQYANKLTMNACDNCGTSCYNEGQAPQYIQFEGQQKRFCSFMCVNTFRTTNKKTVPCAWCSAKKNNFDMIERVDANNKYQLFCSLNCLSLYRVNLQATSNQAVTCDQCRKVVPAQYHLTMSDASVRNFCSYGCVMQFQAQFQAPAKGAGQAAVQGKQTGAATPPTPQTTTRSGRIVTRGVTSSKSTPPPPPKTLPAPKHNTRGSKVNSGDSFPIISNVVSLAPQGTQQQINVKSSTGVIVTGQQGVKTTTTTTGNQTVQQQIIIQPPPPKSVKNKSLMCKPFVQTKATSCRPHTQTKETQTDGKVEPDKYLVPVPVPVYCPTPLAMYTTPTPILIPVPVPIPIPIFIPTTKKSAASIMKQIKEIQEKIPADPLEAELLMMAEAVAEKDSESSSDSDGGDIADGVAEPTMAGDGTSVAVPPSKDVVPAPGAGGELGEDMLQMALRMASEMSEEPVMDLETSLEPVAVSRVPPPAPVQKSEPEDEEEFVPASTRQTRRGGRGGSTKRPSRSTPRRTPKRQRVESQPSYREATPSPPPPQAPPPDANFHLKYTYGVNAFKHWVMQKNAQLEQVATKPSYGKALKTYKSDILQCTADELNFSLCLFVKEVRKPNGEEYAVDSIFYLCLGIQQYLFENGRIDNIFTDIYCDRFTECLNELLTRYEPKMNHSGQLVCRIEEEHLWESKQLGAHSPHVLLNSLVYFNTKFFMLKTSEDHLKLSFTHIMKHWKKTANGRGSGTGANAGRSVYLRYYCPAPQQGKDANAQKAKKKEDMPVYEQTENLDNPLRCPVKLYEFYLSKCPESIKNRNDTFYLVPERSCVPDSPVWYSTAMLGVDAMAKMLNRLRLVREIQEAHLHTQPIYI